jgi:hypothetical protein
MQTIEARSISSKEPSRGTPTAAIGFAKSFDQQHQQLGIEACVGSIIQEVQWNDDAFRIHLDNGQIIQFEYIIDVVGYSFYEDAPDAPFIRSGMDDVVLVQLEGSNFVWNRGDLMRGLRGHKFHKIFVTPMPFGLFLYGSSFGILRVSAMENVRTGRSFLLWSESD